jgi:hypothetical protein
MTTEEDARRTLLVEAQIELYRRQARWEPWKALAAIIAAAAVFGGGVLTVASWWHPSPQTINVRVEGKLPQ